VRKHKRIVVIAIASALILCAVVVLSWAFTPRGNLTMNLAIGGSVLPEGVGIDDIIPQRDALVADLTEKGYEVQTFDTALNSEIPAQRVLAKKGDSFVDICYGLTDEQAKNLFENYKAKYHKDSRPTYYIMAQNRQYLYCVSSRQVFNDAGFLGDYNEGTQYVWR